MAKIIVNPGICGLITKIEVEAAAVHCSHVACPVPTAMLKGVEVAFSLALPKEVEIKFE